MKLSSIDYETLQRAADIADAQTELLERWKRRSARKKSYRAGTRLFLAALTALALASLLTFTSLA
jgi:hypothetical protein